MPLRLSAFIATSLDGFIARPNGALDWLDRANASVPPGEDCGYAAFFSTVDVLVMGRGTFETALTFPSWPYGDLPVVVLSRRGVEVPVERKTTVTVSDEELPTLVARLAAAGRQHAYVDGGQTVQSFLRAGLLHELTLTTIPVLLGAGLPLFGPPERDIDLEHVTTSAFPFGYVQSRYRVR